MRVQMCWSSGVIVMTKAAVPLDTCFSAQRTNLLIARNMKSYNKIIMQEKLKNVESRYHKNIIHNSSAEKGKSTKEAGEYPC